MSNLLSGVFSLLPSLVRLGAGAVVKDRCKPAAQPLVFYDGEFCPYCRYVREALTELDLDVQVFPVPKKGQRFRAQLQAVGGTAKVPFLQDPNTGKQLYESEAIVDYLYQTYGPPAARRPPRLIYLSLVATLLRLKNGMFARPSVAPVKPLELYSFEASPFARLVRETLCELEIPYLLHNVGKGRGRLVDWLPPGLRRNYVGPTANRRALIARSGKMMVPYLVDPNTNTAMHESADIQKYLVTTYGKKA